MDKKILFFDFDGVIHDSLMAKGQSFIELFKNENLTDEMEKAIMDFHYKNGGVSRFVKFKHIVTNILNQDWHEELSHKLNNQFISILKIKLLNSPLVLGAEQFIKKSKSNQKLFIISGAPKNEIISILNEHNLLTYFQEIFGSEDNKSQTIKEIISINNYAHCECVMFGDSDVDYLAAKDSQIDFVAINWSGAIQLTNVQSYSNFIDYMEVIFKNN